MAFPGMDYRLLSMFRFWNLINYYFPYKKDIGEDGNDVLEEMLGRIKNAKDHCGTLGLYLCIRQFSFCLPVNNLR